MAKTWKEHMIETIRKVWFYEDGVLENMPEVEVREIYERLLDFLE